MTTVRADISMSLDGFVAGPDDRVGNGLGDRGELLHEWGYELRSFQERHGREGGVDSPDSDVLEEAFAGVGAFVMGRRMFDIAEEPWGEEPPFRLPVFVVTHRPHEPIEKRGGTTFTFVESFAAALERARAAAGDRDVSIAGGASVIQQALAAGQLDELQVHVVPILLGGGVPLFDGLAPGTVSFEQVRGIASPSVTHLKLRVVKEA